jgi:hypothetical protein
VAFGDESKSVLVTATFPAEREAEMSKLLKPIVLATKRDQEAKPPEPGADSPLTIKVSPKLKATTSIGKTLMFTKDGVVPAKSPEDPLFVAAPSVGKASVADNRDFSVRRLYQTAKTKVGKISSTKPISIDGLDGFEIVADAKDADSGTPLVLYQVTLFDDGNYILMQGLVGKKVSGTYLPEFEAMARSMTRKKE